MSIEQWTTVITSVLEGGVLLYVGRQILCGLKERIIGLEGTIKVQKGTLDAMERRVSETQKIGDIYRTLLSTLPQDIDQFKTIVQKTKDESIVELTNRADQMQRRLHDAESRLKFAEAGGDTVERHLRVLRVLLGKRKVGQSESDFDLAKISEAILGEPELAVPYIVNCQTLDDFLKAIGAVVHRDVADVEALLSDVRDNRRVGGKLVSRAMVSSSVYVGAYALIDKKLYFSSQRYSALQDEFAILRAKV